LTNNGAFVDPPWREPLDLEAYVRGLPHVQVQTHSRSSVDLLITWD
jgi:hypothetical protein